ncbi:hypothetical protein M2352_003700 [Azospirillum fermentarium]|uniref:hypothetical protein n=1 Tax=Azospirillum fermentarium TaxID=1233114 RepID=UPI002227BB19|nr:hypothetical protein [Azospirillum fermentarium]MCW2248066.1 hypothetical protein [Azospirillum fermentarium]
MPLDDEQKSVINHYRIKNNLDPSLISDDEIWNMIPIGLWDYFHPKHPANEDS